MNIRFPHNCRTASTLGGRVVGMTTANSNFRRVDGRAVDETRKVTITRGFTDNLTSSVLVTFGDTRVMCTAFVEQSMSRSKRDSGEG